MKDLPKLELHLHLAGAMPPSFARDLAGGKGMDLSRIFDEDGAYRYDGFLELSLIHI